MYIREVSLPPFLLPSLSIRPAHHGIRDTYKLINQSTFGFNTVSHPDMRAGSGEGREEDEEEVVGRRMEGDGGKGKWRNGEEMNEAERKKNGG